MIEYVRVQNLRVGDMIERTLYDENGRVLLSAGKLLTETAIRVINQMGYKGIYIDNIDEFRRELVPIPEPLVSELTELQLVALLREMFAKISTLRDPFDPQFMLYKRTLHNYVADIADELIEADKKNALLFELEDSRNMSTWIFYHSINVCKLSIGMSIKMGFSRDKIIEVALGAIYHDMGKAWLPSILISKKGLTEEEKEIVREHPEKMFRFLQKDVYSVTTLYAIWQHHEKMDGTGYPKQLKKDKIVDSARIVSCANQYDNLINMNPYDGISMYQSEAIEYMSASENQDVDCLRTLFQIVVPYPTGTKVLLSNGDEAIVVKNVPDLPLRPIVIVNKELVYLSKDPNYLNIIITDVVQ